MLKIEKMAALLVTILIPAISCHPSGTLDGPRHIKRAEQYTAEEKPDEAIAEYRRHMDYRLEVQDRPEWENPFFYLLLIGDLQLKKGDYEEALKSYEEAEKNGVDRSLVADRYRHAGSCLAEQGRLVEALQVLSRYRDRDPLLIDSMRDRIARELVAREESSSIGN